MYNITLYILYYNILNNIVYIYIYKVDNSTELAKVEMLQDKSRGNIMVSGRCVHKATH